MMSFFTLLSEQTLTHTRSPEEEANISPGAKFTSKLNRPYEDYK
jgi:hypothetical protein